MAFAALVLLAGCGPGTAQTGPSPSPTVSPAASVVPASVSTACPAAGTARAAVLTPMKLGGHQSIVYSDQPGANGTPVPSTLIGYDVATAAKTTILSGLIEEAQVSPDGQWISSTTSASEHPTLQLVRLDGSRLQTLYCGQPNGSIRGVLWSPDQKWLLFAARGASGSPTIYQLNTATGALRALLQNNSLTTDYTPFAWLDGTRLLVMGQPAGIGPGSDLRILDMGRGVNQQSSDLVQLASSTAECADMSADGSTLYSSHCNGAFSDTGGSVYRGPSEVTSQTVAGGQKRTIFTSSTLAILQVRLGGQSQLLLNVGNQEPPPNTAGGMNGLWRVNTDGSGLTRLTKSPGVEGQLNLFSQSSWANISRDGRQYAFQLSKLEKIPSYSLLIGPLAGGEPTTIAARADGGQLLIVGWTTS